MCKYAINVSFQLLHLTHLHILIIVGDCGCGRQSSAGQSWRQPASLSNATTMGNANVRSVTAAARVSQ